VNTSLQKCGLESDFKDQYTYLCKFMMTSCESTELHDIARLSTNCHLLNVVPWMFVCASLSYVFDTCYVCHSSWYIYLCNDICAEVCFDIVSRQLLCVVYEN